MKACENCGKCCMGSPCGMAEKHGMTSTYGGRCPALVRSSGKYWCGLVINAVITRMQADICRLIEEKAEIEACVEDLIAIRDQARAVHATGCGTYNDKRTSVDRKKLSDLGLMVKESYRTIPSEFNGSDTKGSLRKPMSTGRPLFGTMQGNYGDTSEGLSGGPRQGE